MALTVTSTALTGELLWVRGTRMNRLAPALPASLALVVQTVLHVQQDSVAHLLTTALLIPAKPLQPLPTTGLTVTSTASTGGASEGLQAPAPALLATWVQKEATAQLAL